MTDVEQLLKQTYAERLDALEPTGRDVGAARREGARMRTKRRLTAGVAAVAVVAVAAAGSLLGTGRLSIGPADGHGSWRELRTPPLSPRAYALSVWTGREVVVLGGSPDPCPPSADCVAADQELRDGAAYDPQTDAWHSIAPAPVPVGPGDRLLSAAGRVVLRHWQQHGSRLFVFDPQTNEWFEIPSFFQDLPSAYGDDVYGFGDDRAHRGRLVMYNARAGVWNKRIPADRIQPKLTDRRVTATPYGPVVTGYEPSDSIIEFVSADIYDGTSWHRLPATKITGNDWAWAGDRMIDFDSVQHQGDETQAGPQLGGQLDPSSGRSGPLPASALETPGDPWSPNAVGPGPWAACWGLAYDVAHGRAWKLPRPNGVPDDGVSAAWADGQLLAFGGADYGSDGANATNHAWLYTP
jgi:hypothetical protein